MVVNGHSEKVLRCARLLDLPRRGLPRVGSQLNGDGRSVLQPTTAPPPAASRSADLAGSEAHAVGAGRGSPGVAWSAAGRGLEGPPPVVSRPAGRRAAGTCRAAGARPVAAGSLRSTWPPLRSARGLLAAVGRP